MAINPLLQNITKAIDLFKDKAMVSPSEAFYPKQKSLLSGSQVQAKGEQTLPKVFTTPFYKDENQLKDVQFPIQVSSDAANKPYNLYTKAKQEDDRFEQRYKTFQKYSPDMSLKERVATGLELIGYGMERYGGDYTQQKIQENIEKYPEASEKEKRVAIGLGGVIGQPIAMTGSGLQKIATSPERSEQVKGTIETVFGALQAQPTGYVYNAIMAQPEVMEAWETYVTPYVEQAKEVVRGLPFVRESKVAQVVTDSVIDMIPFIVADRVMKVPFKTSKKINIVDSKTGNVKQMKIPTDRQWYAKVKNELKADLQMFMKNPDAYIREKQLGLSTKETKPATQVERERMTIPKELPDRKFDDPRYVSKADAQEALQYANDIINAELEYLKASAKKGVTQGNLIKDAQGKVVGRFGRKSNNEQWYRDFYAEKGRGPSLKEMKELAIKRLINGDDNIGMPPDKEFIFFKGVIDNYMESIDKIEVKPPVSIPKSSPLLPKKVLRTRRIADKTSNLDTPLSSDFDRMNNPLKEVYDKNSQLAIETIAKKTNQSQKEVKKKVNRIKELYTKAIEYVQNTDKRVLYLMERPDIKITDKTNIYQKQTAYPGRVHNKIEQTKAFTTDIIKQARETANNFKIKYDDVKQGIHDFLLYRHAPERNKVLGEGAASVTTKKALAEMERLKKTPYFKEMETLANKVQEYGHDTFKILKDFGIISDKFYNELTTKYKNHVSLYRIFEETEDIVATLTGKGINVKNTGLKKAKGSEREVSNILENIIYNREQAILRVEKNIVGNSILDFVIQNKNTLGDLFEIQKPKAIGKTFDGKPIVKQVNDPTILEMFKDGKKILIKVKDPQLATALSGVGREKLGIIMNAIGAVTRFYAGLATWFNLDFALSNKIRDIQEAMVYIAAQGKMGAKGAFKTIANEPSSIKGVIDSLRGKKSKEAALYNEMKELGGTTGGFGLSTKKQVGVNIEKIEKLLNSKTRKIANNLLEYIDNWNTIFEDSTRLSIYKQALKNGMSKERAAFLAKEGTINFNRMGKGGPLMNAMYMFATASIQGSAKMLKAFKNPKILGGTAMTVGTAVAAVYTWNDYVDPDWQSKVTEWEMMNGLPIVLPSEDGSFKTIVIPVSWGLKPMKVAMDNFYNLAAGNDVDLKKATVDMATSIIESYNPVGGTDLKSAVTPTILDLYDDLSRNRKYSGGKIKPDYDPHAPEEIKYFDSLKDTTSGRAAISISEILADKDIISISPADLKYAYESIIGGAGKSFTKFFNVAAGLLTKNPPPLDEYPLISRFYKRTSEKELGERRSSNTEAIKNILQEQSKNRFVLQNKAEEIVTKVKETESQEKKNEILTDLERNNPKLFEKVIKTAIDKSNGLTYEERLINQLGVENGERARYIYQMLNNTRDKKEKAKTFEDLIEKGILTENVMNQIIMLGEMDKQKIE